ncbi:MAG: M56 family metallopeptidase [Bacteroidia bacterium]
MYHFPFPHLLPALGWAFLHSLWIGAVIGLLVKVYVKRVSNKKPQRQYVALLLGQGLLLAGAMTVFFLNIEQAPIHEESGVTFAEMFVTPTQALSYSETVLEFIEQQTPILGLIWIIGVFILILKWLTGWSYMQWVKSKAEILQNTDIQQYTTRIAQQIGIQRVVELRVSSSVFGPCTLGVMRPIILIPASLLTGLSMDQLHAVLAHELAHIKRHDYIINLFQSMIDILFFYHPVQYWMSKRTRESREQCCDDLAIEVTGQPMIYARALAEVAGSQYKPLSPATAFQEGKSHLLVRIQRLFGSYSPRNTRLANVGWAAMLLFIVGAAYYPSLQAQAPSPFEMLTSVVADFGDEEEIATEETTYTPSQNEFGEPEEASDIRTNFDQLEAIEQLPIFIKTGQDTPPPPMPPMPPMPALPNLANMPPLPPMPAMPPMPPVNLANGPLSPQDSVRLEAWEVQMDAYGEQMEAWGEQYGAQWEQWGENFEEGQGKSWEEWGEKFGKQMEAWGEQFGRQMEEMGEQLERDAERMERDADRGERNRVRIRGGRRLNSEEREAMEEHAEEMREHALEMAERAREMSEDRREEAQERAEERREEMQERAEEMRERAQEMRELAMTQRERARDQAELERERAEFRKNNTTDKTREIAAKLREDGYVNENAKRIKIKVTGDKIIVNGKRMSDEDEARYRRLYWPESCDGCTSELTISN